MSRTPYQDPEAESIYQHGSGNPKYAGEVVPFPIGQDQRDAQQKASEDAFGSKPVFGKRPTPVIPIGPFSKQK